MGKISPRAQMSGTAPVYAKITVNGTSGDLIYFHIKDLTKQTCYLHRDTSMGVDIFTITNNPNRAIKILTPRGTGDDFLFVSTLTNGKSVQNIIKTNNYSR